MRRRLSDLTSTSPKRVTAPGGMSRKDLEIASRTPLMRLVATERKSTMPTRPSNASAKLAVLSMTGEDTTRVSPPGSDARDSASARERSWSATPPSEDSGCPDRRGSTEAISRAVSASPRLAGSPFPAGVAGDDGAGGDEVAGGGTGDVVASSPEGIPTKDERSLVSIV